jgi:predicted PurR-regulated permease PerM
MGEMKPDDSTVGLKESAQKEDHPHPRPDLSDLKRMFQGPMDVRSIVLTGLFVLALLFTLHFTKAIFLPVTLAILLNFLFSPLVRFFKKIKIPEKLSAALILIVLLGVVGYGVFSLTEPASRWMQQLPRTMRNVELKLRTIRQPIEKMSRAAEQVEEMTEVEPSSRPQVRVEGMSLTERLFEGAWNLIAGTITVIVLLYFLLASGDMFLRKLLKVLPAHRDKRIAADIVLATESHISRYLVTITLINSGLGIAIGLAMHLVGMPNPLLWGVMAGVFNFIPYVGAICGVLITAVVSLVTFDSLAQGLLAPGLYFLLTSLEGTIITPMILGSRLTLNPVVIFLSLILWGWLWGIPGALLAVPIVATLKIFCDHIEPLAPIGEFLGN